MKWKKLKTHIERDEFTRERERKRIEFLLDTYHFKGKEFGG
jgi:hypothetical protein